jgi:thiosulfate reductase cytochrome b subunit
MNAAPRAFRSVPDMSLITVSSETPAPAIAARHTGWVKCTHWIVTLSFLLLLFSGVEILMVHPRLYWGDVGNGLMPAWLELPISRNHQLPWEAQEAFYEGAANGPVSMSRTFRTFNQNSWGRSLHFLAGWLLFAAGAVYLLVGIFTAHFRRHLLPRWAELRRGAFRAELRDHLRLRIRRATGGPQYGLLQKCAYVGVVFIAFPGEVLTGFTMAPAITAAHPWLLTLFGGYQSARSVHFLLAVTLVLFVAAHVMMVVKSGFGRQLRGMTLGDKKS